MTRVHVFTVAIFAMSVGAVANVACAEDVRGTSDGVAPDAADAYAPPASHDAGEGAEATAPSKPDYDASDEPVVCTSTPCVTQLAAGDRHFCALLSDGSVRCWGDDNKGQLGRGGLDSGVIAGGTPAPVAGLTNVTQISAAGAVTCARNAEGRVQCWGDNAEGQLGLRVSPALVDSARHPTPANVALDVDVARVDVGPSSVCAVGSREAVYCWGANNFKQLARPAVTALRGGPGLAELQNHDIIRTWAGIRSVFGITADGQIVGWGGSGAWGREESVHATAPGSAPTVLPELSDVTNFAVVGAGPASGTVTGHVCAIAGGSVYCWGRNDYGQLGTGVPGVIAARLPVLAVGMPTEGKVFPQQVAVSAVGPLAERGISCVRMTDGTIRCCGNDERGVLGRGVPTPDTPPTSAFARATVFEGHAVQVALTARSVCALVQGGEVVCWGGNDEGQLGQSTRDTEPHPEPMTVDFE